MTFTEAAVEVLRRAGKPLHYREIAEAAVRENLLSHVGQDPEVTMGQRLAAMAKREEDRKVVAVAPDGSFALTEWNVPAEAVYARSGRDTSAAPYDGNRSYVLHFRRGELPPVNAFWSITLYDQDGFQVGNVLNRFTVSSWMPFKYNGDGSLDLYFQNESPGKDKEANWLPAPKGAFNLTMRLYSPKSEALTGKWNPPPVVKAQTTVGLSAQ